MLSIKDLQYYCRTCLVKLENSFDDDREKSIATKKHPKLEQLMQVCLAKDTVGDDNLPLYAPFLCRTCFEKWMDFLDLYQLAIKTDEKIRHVLEKEVLKTRSRENIKNFQTVAKKDRNINMYFIGTENLVDIHEIEKYETSSQLLAESELNNEIDATLLVGDCTQNSDNNEDNLSVSSSSCSEESERTKIISYTLDETSEETRKLGTNVTKSNCAFKRKYRTRKSVLTSLKKSEIPAITDNIDERGEKFATKRVRYQCERCSKYFWEKKKYEGHMKQVHEGIKRPFQCPQCDKTYNLYKTLLQHKRECHSEKVQEIFKCNQCDKIFKTAVILKQHVTNKHTAGKESMRSICDQCGFIAAHQYSLARHIINKHTEADQIKCDQCPKVFKTPYSLKYHILGNHNPSNIKPFKCSECQMGFTRKTLLNQHKRTHLKYNERIKCDFEGCEVRFVKHGDKTHHMRLVHLKVKQHICDFCGEAFGAMQTLRHHRFIHTGEKPYKCNVCGQGFRQRTAMKTHQKTHFGKETESQDVINNLPEINLSLINNLST